MEQDHDYHADLKEEKDDKPPIFKSWQHMYIFVLAMHALIITLFYLLTQAYS